MPPVPDRPPWRRHRSLGRALARPLQRFLAVEAAGGLLLAGAVVVALVWANSPWAMSYRHLWSSELTIGLPGHAVTEDLRHWIGDGLMVLFFFVIGLEIKQELTDGQLTSVRDAAVPAAGALGGMLVPAGLFLAVNLGGPGAAGWGIPMATDVAFALGVLALLGSRVPAELKVLLLALAVVDDVGAIVVIAVAYSGGISAAWLAAAGVGLLAVVALRRAGVRHLAVYVVLGTAIWLATFESGVHATIAGVALGLLTPARPLGPAGAAAGAAVAGSTPEAAAAGAVSVAERLQGLLHPWTGYVIVPLFALANAGVVVSGSALGDAAASPVTIGVVVGLVVGKVVGVTGAILLVTRVGVGRLPPGITTRHVVGLAGIAGIGFTVSIFVAGLAFEDPALTDQATIGILAASLIAAGLGTALLTWGSAGDVDA